MHKLKQSEIAAYRSKLRTEQAGYCSLCERAVKPKDAVLDHCHTSGHIRAVLHSDCNILLGKIENYTKRYGQRLVKEDRLESALRNIVGYMRNKWSDMPYHPTHKTPTDKLARKYRRLIKSSKRPETKDKYRKLLKELRSTT